MKDIYAPNKLITRKNRCSFMFEGFNFVLDTLTIEETTFSVLVVQGFHDNSRELKLPELIKKNIVSEISCKITR